MWAWNLLEWLKLRTQGLKFSVTMTNFHQLEKMRRKETCSLLLLFCRLSYSFQLYSVITPKWLALNHTITSDRSEVRACGGHLSDALIGYYNVLHKTKKGYKIFSSISLTSLLWIALFFTVHCQKPRTRPLWLRKCSENNLFLKDTTEPSSCAPAQTCLPEDFVSDATVVRRACVMYKMEDKKVKTPIYCLKCSASSVGTLRDTQSNRNLCSPEVWTFSSLFCKIFILILFDKDYFIFRKIFAHFIFQNTFEYCTLIIWK